MKRVGLRIDVDTWRGTRVGMPRLLETLEQHGIQASVFFSVGPDNMGRHLWRLAKPAFLWKMLRSKAVSLYGWDILLAGTAWPGRLIGRGNADVMRQTARTHEVGLHAWDHFAWQTWAGIWSTVQLHRHIALGKTALEDLLGQAVTCSAVAGWRADQRVIEAKQCFGFRYNSDCRGSTPFRPRLADGTLGTVQIPVSLHTWDEVIGSTVQPQQFNRYLLNAMHSARGTPVYTVHAEVEGIAFQREFSALLSMAHLEGLQFCPLGALLPESEADLPVGQVVRHAIDGREGWLGCQQWLNSQHDQVGQS
ncbi:4-deoxy-4-formamido-L-arabinose-phosphoundecaprenol deformylase [Candidatus Symbiopectobacterium sp.]|uniref:4-deoxy-4-formamido-L-arabinose- phosphoundecaprenol deformylase n=1 Tax=Candidatus Symbiopectobacterium sp. TaxID=2816440 RepID=UPI0025BFBF1D|nr:4-deoxy-4-formamido-L-arabinose-phosphoundecaprenol deformylase [Candidatus Symbiopectobacterium sp.]